MAKLMVTVIQVTQDGLWHGDKYIVSSTSTSTSTLVSSTSTSTSTKYYNTGQQRWSSAC